MVIFDLMCENGHNFEGWFVSLADLEEQRTGRLISCPVCGSDNVVRRPSTFGLVKSRPAPEPAPAEPGTREPAERVFEAFQRLREMTRTLEREFVDVGADFSNEALKMHYGVTPKRNIRGLSTSDEERLLQREGVEFFKVPMLTRKTTATS